MSTRKVHIVGIRRFRRLHMSFRRNTAFFSSFRVVLVASLRACVLACLADFRPTSACGQVTRWLWPCRQSVRITYDTAIHSPYMRPRDGCEYAGTGIVAVLYWVCRTRLPCCTEMRLFVWLVCHGYRNYIIQGRFAAGRFGGPPLRS